MDVGMPKPTIALEVAPSAVQELFQELLQQSIVLSEDLHRLTARQQSELTNCGSHSVLVDRLLEAKLVTPYQAERILAHQLFGLVLGNYRLLDRLGAGGMGVVFKAEHIRLRRQVAVKVLVMPRDTDSNLLTRFYAETRAVAMIQHPNIVSAIDVGDAVPAEPMEPCLHYFVMEYVPGRDLENSVGSTGPMPADNACAIIVQIAEALSEAHRHGLIHRDIKPSNILVTEDQRAKLLDFGLARNFSQRLTMPGTILGTIGYMAPEQAQDASQVDARADIYSLGATLFWCVTGRDPFPSTGHMARDLTLRLTQPPPSAQQVCDRVPAGLDLAIRRMMALKPDERYPTALAAARALVPFLRTRSSDSTPDVRAADLCLRTSVDSQQLAFSRRVLVVDDDPAIQEVCRRTLREKGILCQEAGTCQMALEMLQTLPFDLVLLDVELPDGSGPDLLKELRERDPKSNLKIILMSGSCGTAELAQALLKGADDFLAKPFEMAELQARVRSILRLKRAQDCSVDLREQLLNANADLEQAVSERDLELASVRQLLVRSLGRMIVQSDMESAGHLLRMSEYCGVLGSAYIVGQKESTNLDENWLRTMQLAAALHDVGMIALPDHVLFKPGRLDSEERILIQTHCAGGADLLQGLAEQHHFARDLLQMAANIARWHHERFDGSGYPEGMLGQATPLAARIVALADVYDALRSKRPYRPGISHKLAMTTILKTQVSQFDPDLLDIFQTHHELFQRIYSEQAD